MPFRPSISMDNGKSIVYPKAKALYSPSRCEWALLCPFWVLENSSVLTSLTSRKQQKSTGWMPATGQSFSWALSRVTQSAPHHLEGKHGLHLTAPEGSFNLPRVTALISGGGGRIQTSEPYMGLAQKWGCVTPQPWDKYSQSSSRLPQCMHGTQ